MGYEAISAVVASGASTASTVQFSRAYPLYGVRVGTMSTGAVVGIFTNTDGGSSFFQIFQPPNPQTSTVASTALQIGSAVGANGGYVVIQGGYNNIQLRTTAVVSGGVSFMIVGLDG